MNNVPGEDRNLHLYRNKQATNLSPSLVLDDQKKPVGVLGLRRYNIFKNPLPLSDSCLWLSRFKLEANWKFPVRHEWGVRNFMQPLDKIQVVSIRRSKTSRTLL